MPTDEELAATAALETATPGLTGLSAFFNTLGKKANAIGRIVTSGRLSEAALESTIGAVVDAEVPAAVQASALPIAAPSTVLLRHNFAASADTAAGGIGTPDVGPGGAWTVTGPGAASARILGGKYITPTGGVSYAYKVLAAMPDVIIARNIWTGNSGPTIGLMDQSTLNTATMNGPHIQTSKTAISPFLFVGGTGGVLRPPTNPPIDSPVLSLVDGVEYETRVDIDRANNFYTTTVTRTSDKKVMGVYTAYDAALSTLTPGPYLLFIEPDANVSYTYIEAYVTVKSQVTPPVRAAGGVSGPVGQDKPDAGFFDRVGVGTKAPSARLHVTGSTSSSGVIVESTHSSGGYLRIKSTTGAEATLHLQRNGEADGASTAFKLVTSATGATIGFGTTVHILIQRSAGVVEITPVSGNNGRLSVKGSTAGTSAGLELTAGSGSSTARVYQANNSVNDLRFATGGSDRVIITSGGAFNILGALDHDGSTVGFYGTTPIAKPTGVAVDAAGIHAALVALGLIAA